MLTIPSANMPRDKHATRIFSSDEKSIPLESSSDEVEDGSASITAEGDAEGGAVSSSVGAVEGKEGW